MKQTILFIDDDPAVRFGFGRYFSASGYNLITSENLSGAERLLSSQEFDAVIIDINLPDGSGLDLIGKIREESPNTPIIVITGAGDIPVAVDAMRKGADNFLVKPVDMSGLEFFLKKSLETGAVRKINTSLLRLRKRDDVYFGNSGVMTETIRYACIAAENDSPILITGETGSGKGVIAKWIHDNSARSNFAFVDVNCSTLKGELLSRELFGNTRGAFTSADRDRDGLMDAADNGTLFLDEIGDMDVSMQGHFLKVLEERTFRRLGDTKVRRSNFRLICATNKDLKYEIQSGAFRRDLFYRINLLTIHIPPLRERTEDLPELVRHILRERRYPEIEITEDAIQMLKTYPWPGNMRELKNVLERALMLSRGVNLTREHFSWLKVSDAQLSPNALDTLEEMKRSRILSAFERCGGDVSKAAKSLGISKATLYRKMKELKDK